MTIESQRFWKKYHVLDALKRIGGLHNVTINNVIGTDEVYGYRSKITIHYDEPNALMGFQMFGTQNVINIEKCLIASSKLNEKYAAVRKTLINQPRKRVQTSKDNSILLFRDCEEGVETEPSKVVTQIIGNTTFNFMAGEFFQNNPFILPIMVNYVIKMALKGGSTHLIDAYCGSGLFAVSAAQQFDSVYGIDINELSVNTAILNAKVNGITNVRFECGSGEVIFSSVSHFPRKNTVVIIDPPRKGCDQVFLRQLFAFAPSKVIYVSCDPVSQARDAKTIVAAGYEISDIAPFDLFPQTRHIENIITFNKL